MHKVERRAEKKSISYARAWAVLAVVAGVALGATVSAPAYAAPVDDQDDGFSELEHGPSDPDAFTKITSGPSESQLSNQAPAVHKGAIPMAIAGFSPAGCAGQTDYAHWSSGSNASVHARTSCSIVVPALGVSTNLQKQGWAYWENVKWGESSRAAASHSQDAHPHWYCGGWGSQNYRGVSSHWSDEASGYYTATTVGAENRFGC